MGPYDWPGKDPPPGESPPHALVPESLPSLPGNQRHPLRSARIWVLAFLLGPLPVGCIAVLIHIPGLLYLRSDAGQPILAAYLGGVWGLAGGLCRKTTGRAILGVNAGAALGYFFGLENPRNSLGVALVAVLGAILSLVIRFDIHQPARAALRHFGAGCATF